MTVSPDVIEQYSTICETVTTEEIKRALRAAFYDHDCATKLYSTRKAFSSLLDWMPVDAQWKKALVVLLFRIEAGRVDRAPIRTNRELAQLLGRSMAAMAAFTNPSSVLSYGMAMREAHYMMAGDPVCIAEGNPFRSFGMKVNDWRPFPLAGVRTLDQLLAHSVKDLLRLSSVGTERVGLIEQALYQRGLSLKSH